MRKNLFFVWAAALLLLPMAAPAVDDCSTVVETSQGPVVGMAHEELPVCEWKGIPYAAPPVGDRRWRPPEPAPERTQVFEAFQFGDRCVSGGSGSGVPEDMLPRASEDCLNLNVWRPAAAGDYPVMVWIHGGSLSVGTAAEPIYWGDRLAAAQNVVVVSINYRLNFYGFMAHPELSQEDPNGSSGNYGLLDQIAALKWVRENAAAFGGDPGNITIFGESAGGWSVCNLLASPLAAGLFDKAILESGGCDVVKSMEGGFKDGVKFAESLGCDSIECMRKMSPEDIELAAEAFKKAHQKQDKKKKLDLKGEMDFKWVPHIDGWALTDKPIEVIRRGEFNRVPLMVGSNRDEAKLFTLAIPFLRWAPKRVVNQMLDSFVGEENTARLRELYPYKNYRRPADMAIDALGDMALGCRCYEAAEGVSEYEPVYYYRFDYDKHSAPHLVGAAHGFEIPFAFGTLDRPPGNWAMTKGQEKQARELSEIMMAYWANFARNGNPNGPGLPEWPEYNRETRLRMFLDLPLRVEPAGNVEQCEFWREQDINLAP